MRANITLESDWLKVVQDILLFWTASRSVKRYASNRSVVDGINN
jgi:hypothetical protein